LRQNKGNPPNVERAQKKTINNSTHHLNIYGIMVGHPEGGVARIIAGVPQRDEGVRRKHEEQ